MLTKERINDRIWVVYGTELEDVPRAFIRFQEFYENRDLKGKIASIQQIEDWWAIARGPDNDQTYYTYWSGFNLPGTVFLQLLKSDMFHQLGGHPEENDLINLIKQIPAEDLPYSYIIGLWKGSTDVLDHEIAHGLFGTAPGYKIAQIENISRLPKHIYNSFSKELLAEGYHKAVLIDEMQAYLSTYPESLLEGEEESRFQTKDLVKYTHPFVSTFKKFMPS